MRVTNKMLTETVLQNMQSNLRRLSKYQDQLSSGKRVTKPSDDPIGTSRILSFNTVLAAQEQYDKNMDDAMGWLDTTDGALDNINEVLLRARDAAVYGANSDIPDESREALALEVDKLVEELVQIANTNYGGRYIFGGSHTTETPFEAIKGPDGKIESVEFINSNYNETMLENTYRLEIEVEAGVKMNVATGTLTFHTDVNGNSEVNAIFDKMIELRKNLEDGNLDEINERIGDVDKLIDNVLSERAVVGAKSKRMELAKDRSSGYQIELNKILGRLEDVDYAEATIQYSVQQTVYQASLATSAQILQPTLINFLR